MKNFLLLIFFLLFVTILFMWDHELTGFWMNPENRNFLLQEVLTWGKKYSYVIDFFVIYKYPITIVGLGYFSFVFFKKWQKKKKEHDKKNIFNGGKVIYDANAILSPESLPEADKKREKKLKNAPALIKKSEENEVIPPEVPNDDLDTETMRRILDSK